MTPTTPLGNLSKDLFIIITEQLVVDIGIYKAVQLRLVNTAFDAAIHNALCNPKVFDINDRALYHFQWSRGKIGRKAPVLVGKILLARSRKADTGQDNDVSVIATVIQDLKSSKNLLTAWKDDDARDLTIAKTVARHYSRTVFRDWGRPHNPETVLDSESRRLNRLCGAIAVDELPLAKSLLQTDMMLINRISLYFGLPLTVAASSGHIGFVRHLLECGADPRASTHDLPLRPSYDPMVSFNDGRLTLSDHDYISRRNLYNHQPGTALGAAIIHGHRDIVKLLLSSEYRLSPKSNKEEFALCLLAGAQTGRLELINLLLTTTGATISDFTDLGKFMLWEAARSGHQGVAQMLLDDGVDINAAGHMTIDGGSKSALCIAASQGNASMVQFLLDRGADVDIKGHSDAWENPLECAATNGHEDVVMMLLDRGEPDGLRRAFRTAADAVQVHLMEMLLRSHPDIISMPTSGTDSRTLGDYALTPAITHKNPRFLRLLVDKGVDLNGQKDGMDPIELARKVRSKWIIDELVRLGVKYEDDEEVGEEDESVMKGGVRITKRTWEWVGKY